MAEKAEKNKGGAPPKWKSAEEMQARLDKYYASCEPRVIRDADGKPVTDKRGNAVYYQRPLTTTGIARALGFRSRQSLYNYRGKKEFKEIIDDALMRVEEYTEERLFDSAGASGAKFSLANNFKGWNTDKNMDGDGDGSAEKLEDIL
ncbi:MAG: hypothetical protein IJY93_00075 [Clostridia bacterium]|nr:hypothetical protein [Clostridia bacterium]